jgi:hypothetical protein
MNVPYLSIEGRIAQLVEHLPYKEGVTGSSPVSPTILKAYTASFHDSRNPASRTINLRLVTVLVTKLPGSC